MSVFQKEIILPEYPRGFHLITDSIIKEAELDRLRSGILHVFIKHTSASLTINENADSTVRGDFERYFNKSVPEDAPYFKHTFEGLDDMPAHIKTSMLGTSVSVPFQSGKLMLGTWQGIYLCEHRNHGGRRKLVITIQGE